MMDFIFKGTKEEWFSPGLDGGERVVCVNAAGKDRSLAHFYGSFYIPPEERDANTKLFLAGKDLLNVAIALATSDSPNSKLKKAALAAVIKATS